MTQQNYSILYVDDEKTNLNAFYLAYWRKFDVILAESGQQGLEILESKHIDVILTDHRMPNMTGIEFLKNVKLKWPNLKYILLTGYTDHEAIKQAINDVGVYWYMNKPFDTSQMERVILNAIKSTNTEKLLKESEDKFRGVFNSMTDVFIRMNSDGICTMISPSVFDVLGYKVDDIIGKSMNDFYVHPEERNILVQNLTKNSNVQTFESDIYIKDGSIRTISSNAKMIFDNDNNPIGIESVFRDVTKNKAIENQLLVYQNQLKEFALELTLSEEKLRKQIACDLHDDVGQLLTSLRLQLASINEKMDKLEILGKYDDVSSGLLKAIYSIKDAIFDLSPPQLNEIGLFAATSDWLEKQIETKYGIGTQLVGDDFIYPLDENTRILLFRSIRELLMNVVKHAKASEVFVAIKSISNKYLEITIRDNGIGFNDSPSKLKTQYSGFGLFSISERMGNLGGLMDIATVPQEGSTIKLIIPF